MEMKHYLIAGVSTSALLLTACGEESIEDIEDSANELEQLHTEVVTELNGLHEDEAALQDAFSETLETDDDLSTLGDGSSAVFENIETRQARLEQVEELEEQFEDQADSLTSYEGETLNNEELESSAEDIEAFTSSLEEYREQYETTLASQEDYFESISSDEATYDVFSEGIQQINEQREEMQEWIIDLDHHLVELDATITQLQERIQEATADSEEGS